MSTDVSHQIAIRIDQKLSDLLNTSEKPSIFKIHGQLRSENEEAYEPRVVSIGPYHHGKPELKEMEKHKLRYFNELFGGRGESSVKYIIALADLQDQARRCYAEEINLSDVDFVEMLCLDGCFVIEFLRKRTSRGPHWQNDPIFQTPWLLPATKYDLILFENQLPFFVLQKLFDMTKLQEEEENLNDLAIHLSLSFKMPHPPLNFYRTIFENYEPVHLLGLVHKILSASFSDETLDSTTNSNVPDPNPFIKSAGELRQSGIKFEKAEDCKSLFHITFKNGVLKIPPLHVHDETESVFRNLIAYEEYLSNPSETWKWVTDYIIFMDFLIDSPSDVETLRRHDIIVNWVGSDEALSTMFNKLCKHVHIGGNFCYTQIFDDVDKYSRKRWHIWRAYLVREYFNNPWAFIAFLAACALLLLTSVQAIFSILQYTSA